MFVGTERRYPYEQSVSSKLFELHSPTKRLRSENQRKPVGPSLIKQIINKQHNVNGYKQRQLINIKGRNLHAIPFTKEMFYDVYSMSKINLSFLEKPENLGDVSFFKAPESYYEFQRSKEVEKYLNLIHWDKSNRFNTLLKRMKEMFKCNGAAISLIDSKNQITKFQIGYGFQICSRQISIDSHTILSKDFFLILDASKDWRFKGNPLVKDYPHLKFYLGVPLIGHGGQVIGVLSIFDSFSRTSVDEKTIKILIQMSEEIMRYLDLPIKNTRIKGNEKAVGKIEREDKYIGAKEKLFEMYGRATSNNQNKNQDIIFEKDGSGTSYKYNSSFQISASDGIIDSNVWNQLTKFCDFNKACDVVCEILKEKFKYDCIYIVNVKTSKLCYIKRKYFPMKDREVLVKNFGNMNKIEWRDDRKDEMKTKIQRIKVNRVKIEEIITRQGWGYEFYNKVNSSKNGIIYKNKIGNSEFNSGISLPFFKYDDKLLRKGRKNSDAQEDKMELFFKSNGYLVSCFSKENRQFSEEEIGYVYGCVMILRKMFFQE